MFANEKDSHVTCFTKSTYTSDMFCFIEQQLQYRDTFPAKTRSLSFIVIVSSKAHHNNNL